MSRYLFVLRRYFLDTPGKICLPRGCLLLPLVDSLQEVSQSQEILHLKSCATCSHDDTWIGRDKTGPGRWERSYMIRGLVERDPILSPVVAIIEDLKLLSVQGMKGMGNGENSFR